MGKNDRVLITCLAALAVLFAAGSLSAGSEEDESERDREESGGAASLQPAAGPGQWRIVGWNDLGMHCMDGKDYSVLSILPPANTIHAHVVDPAGRLVTNPAGITVTYAAVADLDGSINTTTQGKTNFWEYVQKLFGVALAPDPGLAGFSMPGPSNQPQPMRFDGAEKWFTGEFIPISPVDDAGGTNPYPMMRLTARNAEGAVLARTDIVLPVSDEMDCRKCHAAGSVGQARPAAGWITDSNPEREYKLNILALHDERNFANPAYPAALDKAGYNRNGLLAAVQNDGQPILCVQCHPSNALAGIGVSAAKPLTQAVHGRHAQVTDPERGLTLDDSDNRSACYTCHPGAETRCLRGAMGAAVAPDGTLAMQCQSCHGSMSAVASPDRRGWLDEPGCGSCHTGTATQNRGQIRYPTVFEPATGERQPADARFDVNPDKLYRFSAGHGGLQCAACHHSPHAIYPSSHGNDNVQSIALQGHIGTLSDCAVCHGSSLKTVDGGPHGMHPVGASWVERHGDAAEHGAARCGECHGSDFKGSVLSRALGPRVLDTKFGTKVFWKGYQVGCYNCHNGPADDDRVNNHPAFVFNAAVSTSAGVPAAVPLRAVDRDGNQVTLRIVSQPRGGTVALSGREATYHPFPDFRGADYFSFAAWDGLTDSNLGVVKVTVE